MVDVGDGVKDIITGLTGIAVCRCEWLYGCVRVGVQPCIADKGKVPDIVYVDEPQLEVVKRDAVATAGVPKRRAVARTHGPPGREEQSNRGRPADDYHREE